MCEKCGKRPATVHVQRIVNGEKSESHLCQKCAAENNELGVFIQPLSVNSLLSAMLGGAESATPRMLGGGKMVRCPSCGLSYVDFAQNGRLGCGRCYSAFEKQLEGLLRRIHGSDKHIGKMPKKAASDVVRKREIDELRAEMARAVEAEEYEKAASIRDRIRNLEKARS